MEAGRAVGGAERRRHAQVGAPRLWRMKRAFQIDFLKRMGLEPHDYLLDLGCGTLRGGIPLIEYLDSGHYYGIEVRSALLEEARAELRAHGLEQKDPVLLFGSTPDRAGVDRTFAFIWAFSVLIHMTDEVLDETLAFVSGRIEDGAFYANVKVGKARTAGPWHGFPVVTRELRFYEEAAGRHGLAVTDMGTLMSLGHSSGKQPQDRQRMLRFERAPSAA